ncbi:uncharacterized protein [Cherax quadricarinatus]|uniref:uncharacterized protein n=1 Tax=Cherax quadricarinatus TaxID=27406 RepID=UPI00387E6468
MDSQPLDFSTKKNKYSAGTFTSELSEPNDSDHCSYMDDGLAASLIHERKLWSQSSESGVSLNSDSPERVGSPRSHCGSPMAFSSVRHAHYPPIQHLPPHVPHSPLNPSIPASFNSTLFAQIHSNPLLFSTLQSALNKANLTHPLRAYLAPFAHSPTPKDFSTPLSHPVCPSPAASLPLTSSTLGMGALDAGNLGLSAASLSPKPAQSLSPNILGAFEGVRDGVGYGVGSSSSALMGGTHEELNIAAESNEAYSRFRQQMLVQVTATKARRAATCRKTSHSSSVDFASLRDTYSSHGDPSSLRDPLSHGDPSSHGDSSSHRDPSSHEDPLSNGDPPSQGDASSFRDSSSLRNSSSSHGGPSGFRVSSSLRNSSSSLRDRSEDGDSRSDINIDVCGFSSEVGSSAGDGGVVGDADGDNSCDRQSSCFSTNTKRKNKQNGDYIKDEAYWERRRKNNEAAKRSRDARRAKEDEIAIRAAFLEQENLKLRVEVASLKSETSKLRCLLYTS